jgi:predicted nucleotidyltransferase
MIPLIDQKRAELDALCTRYRVQRLALFGSAAADGFDPATSDLDFAVEFEQLTPSQHREAYFGLLDDLRTLFGREVDLVEWAPIRNPYFLRSLLETQVMLYAAA